jgi:Kef-type K+ transport system membrane component KefB
MDASQIVPAAGQLQSSTINLLLVMTLVWTAGVIFRWIHQPPILGELLAGIIFGPTLLGIIKPDSTLMVLSELGVFFIMFYAGLETNLTDLRNNVRQSVLAGTGGVLLPFALGFSTCLLFEIDILQALVVGLGLSITAIAVNARVLYDLDLQRYRVTPVIMGASIIDDVLSLALFSSILGMASSGSFNLSRLVMDGGKVVLFFGVTFFLGIRLFPKLGRYFSSREAKGFTFSLIMALLFGYLAELAGLHIMLGAYLAGAFVSKAVVHEGLILKIRDRFVAITYGFLGPIFFVSLSFHMTFDIFTTHFWFLLIIFIVAVTGKIIGAGAGALAAHMTRQESAVVAFAMNGRGAVELIIASVCLQAGIINDSIFSVLVAIAFFTTMFSPISLSILLKKTDYKGLVPNVPVSGRDI